MHVMSPLRLQYGERSSQQREACDIYTLLAREDRHVQICAKKAPEDEGLLGILSGTYNKRWDGGR